MANGSPHRNRFVVVFVVVVVAYMWFWGVGFLGCWCVCGGSFVVIKVLEVLRNFRFYIHLNNIEE